MSLPVILRGRVLTFTKEPKGPGDTDSYRFFEDGGVTFLDGKITALGCFSDMPQGEVIDHRPHLILPGLIDAHVHFPQVQVIASYSAELLDWLKDYTFPAEIAFENADHAARMASAFYDILIANGTTTAVAFCSSHPNSVDAYFAEAAKRNMRMMGGKVMMDRNAPDALCDTAQSSYDDSKMLIDRWHDQGRASYVISPRFAITSTPDQLAAAGALAAKHPHCAIQTHMNESNAEIDAVAALFPQATDYLSVYEQFGLLRQNTLLGHCIHMTDRELAAMAEHSAAAIHCPTSNLFLGSGLYDRARMTAHTVKQGVASDIGGGTSYSMLKTLDAAFKIQQLHKTRLDPLQAYYWATRGNAQVLGLVHEIGTLDVGSAADCIVLDAAATPDAALRFETIATLEEELFLLQTLGDDRMIAQVYVAGRAAKNTPAS